MTAEQETRIEVLIESLDYDEYDVIDLFSEYDFEDFIFPEDVEAVSDEVSVKVIQSLEERCFK